MAIDKRVQKMVDGDKNAIIDGFISSSCVLRVNAIIQAVLHKMKDKTTEVQLHRLKKDDTYIFDSNVGYRVSDFAYAALHLLGFARYEGTDKTVVALIDSKLEI